MQVTITMKVSEAKWQAEHTLTFTDDGNEVSPLLMKAVIDHQQEMVAKYIEFSTHYHED